MIFDSIHYSVIERKEFYYKHLSHEDWTIYMLRSGAFRCKFHGQEDVIREGDVYIIPPNTPFERSTITPFCVDFIRFTLYDPQELPFPIPYGKHVPRDGTRLLGTLRLMRALQKKGQAQPTGMISRLLCDFLLQIVLEREVGAERDKPKDQTVEEILRFFEENYSKKISICETAERYGLSPSGLIFKFKRATGIQPMRHLIAIRIKHAKRLLTSTSLAVSEIATAVGFDNCYYFSNAFKQETGQPPSEFRRINSI